MEVDVAAFPNFNILPPTPTHCDPILESVRLFANLYPLCTKLAHPLQWQARLLTHGPNPTKTTLPTSTLPSTSSPAMRKFEEVVSILAKGLRKEAFAPLTTLFVHGTLQQSHRLPPTQMSPEAEYLPSRRSPRRLLTKDRDRLLWLSPLPTSTRDPLVSRYHQSRPLSRKIPFKSYRPATLSATAVATDRPPRREQTCRLRMSSCPLSLRSVCRTCL